MTWNEGLAIREEDSFSICAQIDKFILRRSPAPAIQDVDSIAHPNLTREVVVNHARIGAVNIYSAINECSAICATSPYR